MDWLARLEAPQNAIAVLTAMITPAVMISACGALIFSTTAQADFSIEQNQNWNDLLASFQPRQPGGTKTDSSTQE